jgi:membrane protein
MRQVDSLFKLHADALSDFIRNNCPNFAAGIAYWTLFSLFPLALAGFSLLGFIYSSPEAQVRATEAVIGLVPVSAEYIEELVQELARARGTLGVVAVIGLLIGGSTVFSAVRKGVNHCWHIGHPNYFLFERAIDLLMLLGLGALAMVMVVLSTNFLGLGSLASVPERVGGGFVGVAVVEIATFAVTYGVLLLLYRFVPNTSVQCSDVWGGALAGALMFQAARIGFGLFLSLSGGYTLLYGSLSAVMAVLTWAFLSSLAILWGAQLSYTYARTHGSHRGEIGPPVPNSMAHRRPHHHQTGLRGVIATGRSWLLPPRT